MASFLTIQLKFVPFFLLLATLYVSVSVPVSASASFKILTDSDDSLATEIEFLLDDSDQNFLTEDEFVQNFIAQEAILESKINSEFDSDGDEDDELLTASNLYDIKTTRSPISSAFNQILRQYAKLAPKVILSSRNSDVADKYAEVTETGDDEAKKNADVTEFDADDTDIATGDADVAERDAVVAKSSGAKGIPGSRVRADMAERDSDVEKSLTLRDVTVTEREEGSEGRQTILSRKMLSLNGRN